MPKIIRLRDVKSEEMLELKRLASKGTHFEARRVRFIFGIDQACGASPQSNWGSPRVFCLHQQQLA
jgi:hypothetical protein